MQDTKYEEADLKYEILVLKSKHLKGRFVHQSVSNTFVEGPHLIFIFECFLLLFMFYFYVWMIRRPHSAT